MAQDGYQLPAQPYPSCHTPGSLPPEPLGAHPTGDRAGVAYNHGLCITNVAYSADLHVCSFCLQTALRLCQHSELNCKSKMLTQKRAMG